MHGHQLLYSRMLPVDRYILTRYMAILGRVLCSDCCTEVYSDPFQTSNMEFFAKIVNVWKPFTIFAGSSILDVWEVSEYTSVVCHSHVLKLLLEMKFLFLFLNYLTWTTIILMRINVNSRMFDAFQEFSTSPMDSTKDTILTIVFEHVEQDLSQFLRDFPSPGLPEHLIKVNLNLDSVV